MKKFIMIAITAYVLLFSGITVCASERRLPDINELVREYQDKVREMIDDMDESTVNKAFSFLKEKAANGGLRTEEDIKKTINEGKEELGVEVKEEYIEEMVDLVNTLENMGFDSEKLIETAENMYQKYGADLVDHTQELVVKSVKASIGTIIINSIRAFFRILAETVKNFFINLF